jgi:hypothetical protein
MSIHAIAKNCAVKQFANVKKMSIAELRESISAVMCPGLSKSLKAYLIEVSLCSNDFLIDHTKLYEFDILEKDIDSVEGLLKSAGLILGSDYEYAYDGHACMFTPNAFIRCIACCKPDWNVGTFTGILRNSIKLYSDYEQSYRQAKQNAKF